MCEGILLNAESLGLAPSPPGGSFLKGVNIMTTNCQRCDVRCQVDEPGNKEARLLRRSRDPKGLCVNCAVHDWLRNTYPVNMLLAKSGPKSLVHPHIQEQFAGIMRLGMADAMPDEIDWGLIIENWDLPFPHKVKPRGENPCSQPASPSSSSSTK